MGKSGSSSKVEPQHLIQLYKCWGWVLCVVEVVGVFGGVRGRHYFLMLPALFCGLSQIAEQGLNLSES